MNKGVDVEDGVGLLQLFGECIDDRAEVVNEDVYCGLEKEAIF